MKFNKIIIFSWLPSGKRFHNNGHHHAITGETFEFSMVMASSSQTISLPEV